MTDHPAGLAARVHLLLTSMRYAAAVRATRDQDCTPLERLRARTSKSVFTIVGPGATINDLGHAERAVMAAGVTAAVNMAALASMDFDLCSLEAMTNRADHHAYRVSLLAKSRLPLLWFQDRARHASPFVDELDQEFGLYRYRRASVSIERDLGTFRFILNRFMLPRVLERPNLRVSFALTGSIARLTLLALSLGYRDIRFAGVDLGSTAYFWLERPQEMVASELSAEYQRMSPGALRMGGGGSVPNLFEFLQALLDEVPGLQFQTFDPRGRSRLTPFLYQQSRYKQ
ncbi:hypothetical protein [Tabrizicola sp.]|uniref:hypothetical protein n=1 Tax=Tabrizicola sp. TaxID=2005166 RepID=UPI002633EA35|nr:hypothetical protein [Tabrizicola sp.]MDM7932023.1 hypothetical protein [Tabrizicola sp.]